MKHAIPYAPDRDENATIPAPDSIYREGRNRSPSGPGWQVRLHRQARTVARSFRDSVHGGPQEALAAAVAYRDAVMAAIPPATNHQQATKVRRTNVTGISGVGRRETDGRVSWIATLLTGDGQRLRSFPVDMHGEEDARDRAIAQRRAWLRTLPPRYLSMNDAGRAVSAQGNAPAPAPDVHALPFLPAAEIDARLAAIDARFDALRPPRLRARVRSYATGSLAVAVSDGGRPARRRLVRFATRGRAMDAVLADVAQRFETMIGELYGARTARWFLTGEGAALLDPERFDPAEGFNVCLMVPRETIGAEPEGSTADAASADREADGAIGGSCDGAEAASRSSDTLIRSEAKARPQSDPNGTTAPQTFLREGCPARSAEPQWGIGQRNL